MRKSFWRPARKLQKILGPYTFKFSSDFLGLMMTYSPSDTNVRSVDAGGFEAIFGGKNLPRRRRKPCYRRGPVFPAKASSEVSLPKPVYMLLIV